MNARGEVPFGLTARSSATGRAATMIGFLVHPIYVHGLQFHASNEFNVQLPGGRIDVMHDGLLTPFE